jgi:hypothetical protein
MRARVLSAKYIVSYWPHSWAGRGREGVGSEWKLAKNNRKVY